MSEIFRVGLTRDFLGADGKTPVFDPAAFGILQAEKSLSFGYMPDATDGVTPAQAAGYDAIVVLTPRVTARTLPGADPRLELVARLGVCYDNVDTASCTPASRMPTITPDA